MKPSAILKFVSKLVVLEACIVVAIANAYVLFNDHGAQGNGFIVFGSILYFFFATPLALIAYIMFRTDFGSNNKNVVHSIHALTFLVSVLLVGLGGNVYPDSLWLVIIPGSGVMVATGIAVYMKSPRVSRQG